MIEDRKYFYSVDWLKGVAALCIAIYHFLNYEDANGSLFPNHHFIRTISQLLPAMVFSFFLISGFVMAVTMNRQQYHIKKFTQFLGRRWVRIAIPYLTSILVYLLIAYAWSLKRNTGFHIPFDQFFHHLTYTAALFDYEWYNDVYWTLALEFQFYITIAFLFPLFFSKSSIVNFGVLILFSLSGIFFDNNELVFKYAPMFVLGILTYNYIHKSEKYSADLILIALALLQIAITFDVLTSIYLLLTIYFITFKVSERNIFVRFGRFAYSFYLLHGAVGASIIYFLAPLVSSDISKYLVLLMALFGSTLFSYLCFRFVEKPSVYLSRKITFSKRSSSNNLR